MRLERLAIDLCEYGVNRGLYTGEAKFKNEYGGVSLILTPEVSKKVLEICAEQLVNQAARTGQLLTTAILEQAKPSLASPERVEEIL